MTRFGNRMALGLGALVLIVGVGAAGFAAAQNQDNAPDHRPFSRRGGPEGPGGPGGFIGRGGPGGPMAGMILRDLDLTDAQEEQVRSILEARRAADAPLMERAGAARQALQTAVQTRPVDEAAIRARAAELAVVEADLAVSQARLQAELFELLTPEQQTQVNERREQMQERREEFRAQRGRP